MVSLSQVDIDALALVRFAELRRLLLQTKSKQKKAAFLKVLRVSYVVVIPIRTFGFKLLGHL